MRLIVTDSYEKMGMEAANMTTLFFHGFPFGLLHSFCLKPRQLRMI